MHTVVSIAAAVGPYVAIAGLTACVALSLKRAGEPARPETHYHLSFSVAGDLNIGSPHATGAVSAAAGRDGAASHATHGDARIVSVDRASAGETLPSPEAACSRNNRLVAVVLTIVLLAAVALLIAGLKETIVAIVIAGSTLVANVVRLANDK